MNVKAMIKADPSLMGRMYQDYRTYYTNKGVDEDLLMSFAEWSKHLGLD